MAKQNLEEYFRDNDGKQVIDHAIRARIDGDNVVFYIHPNGVSGETLDFQVHGNNLTQLYTNSAVG